MPAPSSTSTMTTITNDAVLADAGLYRMLAWLSPGFPIGAFSYSHGLEAAAEAGRVRDRSSLQGWIAAVVARGSGRVDADILRDAHRAAAANDIELLSAVNRRGLAYRATAELALETSAQGEAFLATCRAAWPEPFCTLWATSLDAVCHPAAVGAAMARAGIPIASALTGYLHAMAANLTSAGLRLGIIGQTDGQRILAALEPLVVEAAAAAIARDRAGFGAATLAVDLASMAHETQYSRLFRS
jgi:urease accessory protein